MLEAERLLSQEGAQQTQEQTVTRWRDHVARCARRLPPPYAHCLAHFVGVLTRMQPQLCVWTATAGLPRTNHDLQRFLRAMTTRSRRRSGRTNWQSYLLRYGQRIAFYEAHCLTGKAAVFARHLRQVAYAHWPHARVQHRPLAHRLRTQVRFLHRRTTTLRALEQRWAQALDST